MCHKLTMLFFFLMEHVRYVGFLGVYRDHTCLLLLNCALIKCMKSKEGVINFDISCMLLSSRVIFMSFALQKPFTRLQSEWVIWQISPHATDKECNYDFQFNSVLAFISFVKFHFISERFTIISKRMIWDNPIIRRTFNHVYSCSTHSAASDTVWMIIWNLDEVMFL